jgi:hypothetical protein
VPWFGAPNFADWDILAHVESDKQLTPLKYKRYALSVDVDLNKLPFKQEIEVIFFMLKM